jgi:pimeloyl-ACP methyl ester carboxylesterase
MSTDQLHYERVEANGLSFRVATAGEGDRLALLLHGFPELAFSWRHQISTLVAQGYRVWAPDLRGYGGTDKPKGVERYAIENLVADVGGLIDASGARSTFLMGHDWGAIVAWIFAIRRTRELDRLAILNVPHPALIRENATWRQPLRSWYIAFFQIPWLPEKVLALRDASSIARVFTSSATHPDRFPEPVLQVYRDAALQPGALTAMLNYYRALVRGGQARQARLGFPVVDVPTLMLWGENDVALGIELTHGTDRYVSDLTLRYLPGVSHWVQQDDPETVNAMLEAWLQGRVVPEKTSLASMSAE